MNEQEKSLKTREGPSSKPNHKVRQREEGESVLKGREMGGVNKQSTRVSCPFALCHAYGGGRVSPLSPASGGVPQVEREGSQVALR